MVAPEALVAPGAVELGLEAQDVLVGREHAVGPVLPQLLDVAEHDEPVARLQVVAERGGVCALAAQEVVRTVTGPLVVVGEDDEPGRAEAELEPGRGRVVEHAVQPLGDRAPVGLRIGHRA